MLKHLLVCRQLKDKYLLPQDLQMQPRNQQTELFDMFVNQKRITVILRKKIKNSDLLMSNWELLYFSDAKNLNVLTWSALRVQVFPWASNVLIHSTALSQFSSEGATTQGRHNEVSLENLIKLNLGI